MDISQVQNWFKTVIVGQGRLPEKVARAEHQFGFGAHELIKGDDRVPVEMRMGIYTTGYMLRLLECMQADLPSLYTFWGEQLFDMFGRSYLLEHPSNSHSLYELTEGYADFLERTRPPVERIDPENAVQYDIPAELVRMERARLAAILSKGTEGQTATPSLGFFSFFSGEETMLQAHPALQLVRQKMPLVEFYRQLMQNDEVVIPEYETSYLAVTRLNFRIQFYQINEWQYHLLHGLKIAETSVDLHDAIHYVSEHTGLDKAQLLSDVCLWLPNAISMGLIEG